jgi:hypothetical protein
LISIAVFSLYCALKYKPKKSEKCMCSAGGGRNGDGQTTERDGVMLKRVEERERERETAREGAGRGGRERESEEGEWEKRGRVRGRVYLCKWVKKRK